MNEGPKLRAGPLSPSAGIRVPQHQLAAPHQPGLTVDWQERFITEADRGLISLLPESLDDDIDETNPARAIVGFISHLDLAEIGVNVMPEAMVAKVH